MDQWNFETIKSRFDCFGEEFDWRLLTTSEKDYYQKEFRQEIQNEHPLYNIICHAIAKRYSKDDVLFVLENDKWIILHLTFSSNNSRGWPKFEMFENCDTVLDFIERQYSIEFL